MALVYPLKNYEPGEYEGPIDHTVDQLVAFGFFPQKSTTPLGSPTSTTGIAYDAGNAYLVVKTEGTKISFQVAGNEYAWLDTTGLLSANKIAAVNNLYSPNLDTASGVALTIGGTNATSVALGKAGVTVNAPGVLQEAGSRVWTAATLPGLNPHFAGTVFPSSDGNDYIRAGPAKGLDFTAYWAIDVFGYARGAGPAQRTSPADGGLVVWGSSYAGNAVPPFIARLLSGFTTNDFARFDQWSSTDPSVGAAATVAQITGAGAGLFNDGIDTVSAVALSIGDTNATSIALGKVGVTVNVPGTLQEAGSRVWTAATLTPLALASTTPAAIGTAAVGTGTTAARSDHVHNIASAAITAALGYTPLKNVTDTLTGTLNVTGQLTAHAGYAPTYTSDGLFGATATPSWIMTPSGTGKILFGYTDAGGGQYGPRLGFVQPTAAGIVAAQVSIGPELNGDFTIHGGPANTEQLRISAAGNVNALVQLQEAGSRVWTAATLSPVTTARQVIAGAGLTGGGALSADVTLNVVANADGSITVAADSIQVGVLATDAQHGTRGGGTLHAAVTTSVNGFMLAADKSKLDGIAAGAQVNDTAAQILAKLITVDGGGSSLDADLLDGLHATSFASGVAAVSQANFDLIKQPGLYQYDGTFSGTVPPVGNANFRTVEIGNANRYSQIALPYNADGLCFRRQTDGVWSTWRTVWHDGNLTNLNQLTNGPGYITPAGTAAAVANTVTGTNSVELVRGNMADSDMFRIRVGATASNAGYAEIATADDGTEPIYVCQYTGAFATIARTAALLDSAGNTSFPGAISGQLGWGHYADGFGGCWLGSTPAAVLGYARNHSQDYLQFCAPNLVEEQASPGSGTWATVTPAGVNELFSGMGNGSYALLNGKGGVRFTWTAFPYRFFDLLYAIVGTNGNSIGAKVETSANGTSWSQRFDTGATFSNWPGYFAWKYSFSQSGFPYLRITFYLTAWANGSNIGFNQISYFGDYYRDQINLFTWSYDKTTSFGGSIRGPNLTLRDDCIENYGQAIDTAIVGVNYSGYNGGITYYRDFNVYNGKNVPILTVAGSTGVVNARAQLQEAGSRAWTAATLTNLNQLTNGPGYITSVAGALGYTPVNKAGDTMTGALSVPTVTATAAGSSLASEGWITISSLGGGWANYGSGLAPAAYYKDSCGIVHLRGVIYGGTVNATIFQLPSGYRPQYQCTFACMANWAFGTLSVGTGGLVTFSSGSNASVFMDVVSFRADGS